MRRNRLAIFSGRLINVLFHFLDCRAVELLWSREDCDRLHVAGGVDESVYLDTSCHVVPQGFRRRNGPHRVNELGLGTPPLAATVESPVGTAPASEMPAK